ncbi:MAG: DUF4931 domain-containing protein [Candidatus Bipolaricaulota bacterium]
MAEIRRSPTKGTWSIIAEKRGDRPYHFDESQRQTEGGGANPSEDCPLCEGREDRTPPEVFAIRNSGKPNQSGWSVRVAPNKFPALDPEATRSVIEGQLYTTLDAFGYHEVIVETPNHQLDFLDQTKAHRTLVLQTYKKRLKAVSESEGIKHVLIFRNYGDRAGASLTHPHSQLLAAPFLPTVPKLEYQHALKYYEESGNCLYCDLLSKAQEQGDRVLFSTSDFLALTPFAPRFPYEIHLVSRIHSPAFDKSSENQLKRLAGSLHRALAMLEEVLGGAAYNYVLHTAHQSSISRWPKLDKSYHWHFEIFPRITTPAGFEWGAGDSIVPISPERARDHLRK